MPGSVTGSHASATARMQLTSGAASGSKTRPPCPCLRRPTSWPRPTEREPEMDAETLLPRLFPQGHAVVFDGEFFTVPARCGATDVTVIVPRNKSAIGVELPHLMAEAVLETLLEHPGRPMVLLVDTAGQRLSRRDGLLGVNGYMAHLAGTSYCGRSQVIEIARTRVTGRRNCGHVNWDFALRRVLVCARLCVHVHPG